MVSFQQIQAAPAQQDRVMLEHVHLLTQIIRKLSHAQVGLEVVSQRDEVVEYGGEDHIPCLCLAWQDALHKIPLESHEGHRSEILLDVGDCLVEAHDDVLKGVDLERGDQRDQMRNHEVRESEHPGAEDDPAEFAELLLRGDPVVQADQVVEGLVLHQIN